MSTITSSSTNPTFQAGGLASGLDTASIINSLVQIESQPITRLQTEQSSIKAKISTLGDLVSKLSALDSATTALKTSGTLGVTASSSNTTFSATPGANATPGRYSIQVQQLATAAKFRSQAFSSETVAGGTLSLTVMGKTYDSFQIDAGASLADVADAINAVGAPVSAVVLTDDNGDSYLSLTNLNTGVAESGDTLSLTYSVQSPLGAGQQVLTFDTVVDPQNALLVVDGLSFTRQNNSIADVIPGVTIDLKSQGAQSEDLVLSSDAASTQKKLQTFVDAYNSVMSLLQKQLDVDKSSDSTRLLNGNFSIRNLSASLQQLLTTQVGNGPVRALVDLGVKSDYLTGTLSIDSSRLQQAIALSPQAVNSIFSDNTSGLAKVVSDLVDVQTDTNEGLLTMDSKGLSESSSRIDSQILQLQANLQIYRQQLQAKFTAMEQLVSGFKSIGNYLTQQFNKKSSDS